MTHPSLALSIFAASREEALGLLKRLDMFDYAPARGATSRIKPRDARACKTYLDEWKYYRDNNYFDVVLSDLALLQFAHCGDSVSYSYHACPMDALSYDDFVLKELGEADPNGFVFEQEYEQYLSQAPVRQNAVTMRFDYDPTVHRPGTHPAGHLHIGHQSHIRLGCAWLMTPLAFVLLVLRQLYPHVWASRCLTDEKIRILARRLRHEEHRLLGGERLSPEEQLEYYLQ